MCTWSSSAFVCSSPWLSAVFICFSIAFLKGKWVNLACSLILLYSEGSISLPIRYSYLSIFSDNNIDIFAASLLIWHCSFSSLIFSSVIMISFHIFSKRLFLKFKGLSDARVQPLPEKNMALLCIFCKHS